MDIRLWMKFERRYRMINREIIYERDVNTSYMKIPAVREVCLDEKLILRRDFHGILPMEKCYVNGYGQYWYNISGKQALDAYCRVNLITQEFFENLILRICSQLEILEWNLIDTSCLVIDPELIFVNHSGEDISFILYPDTKGNFFEELQQLMEYLLTKLCHGDKDGVQQAYRIYNMTLNEGYSIKDVKQEILGNRETDFSSIIEITNEEEEEENAPNVPWQFEKKEELLKEIEKRVIGFIEQVKKMLGFQKENKEEIPEVVYPDEAMEEETTVIHPTVCLCPMIDGPQGRLIYEGKEDYSDFNLEKESCVLGKNPKVKLHLNRETISQFHAKLDYKDEKYYIEDLNSTNGTFVNDEILNYKEKRQLQTGDIIRFADVKYRFL